MNNKDDSSNAFIDAVKSLLLDTARTSWTLFRILIPVAVVTHLLDVAGLIKYLALLLSPFMDLVGLPGSMGLVWATAMMTNIYGGMAVFASLAPGAGLTAAQVTILGTMILVAHALPAEAGIARQAGTRLGFTLTLRIVAALLLGFLMHVGYSGCHLLKEPYAALWRPDVVPDCHNHAAWAIGQLKNLGQIFVIILILLIAMRVLKALGVIDWLERVAAPLLRPLGIGATAMPLVMAGMLLGISYGGGLIIREAVSGSVSRRETFYALTLLGLFHSVIEDTMLMVAIGARLSGVVVARLVFTAVGMLIFIRVCSRLPDEALFRFCMRRN